MFKSIKALFNDIASVINTNAETLNESSKLVRDNVKAMRLEQAIELEQEFAEKNYTPERIKEAVKSRNELFSSLD